MSNANTTEIDPLRTFVVTLIVDGKPRYVCDQKTSWDGSWYTWDIDRAKMWKRSGNAANWIEERRLPEDMKATVACLASARLEAKRYRKPEVAK